MLGSGAGVFRPPLTIVTGASPFYIAVGDFNGDGRPDAVSANPISNNVSVLLNDGNWPSLDQPSITINNATVTEGNIGTVSANFTVSLSAAYSQTVTVHYATADGSASAGSDYQAASGDSIFAPGVTSQNITVLVNGDRLGEYTGVYSESFFVRLSDATNAFLARASGSGQILDDEPTMHIEGYLGVEGNSGVTLFPFVVTLSAAYDVPVTVDYATADLTPDEQRYGALARRPASITRRLSAR